MYEGNAYIMQKCQESLRNSRERRAHDPQHLVPRDPKPIELIALAVTLSVVMGILLGLKALIG